MKEMLLASFLLCLTSHVRLIDGYIVGAGLNVRFAQMLYSDSKYQVLREEMVKANTRNLVYHCRSDKSDCEAALAKMRYKASKHFYALAKAVVDYVKNKRQARPTGYVGTATFCQDNICIPDTDPPIVLGGCYTLISCGGNQTWHLDPVLYKKKKARLKKVKPVGAPIAKSFIPLTEFPPPHVHHSGRRHYEECDKSREAKQVYGGAKVDIFGEYYDDGMAKTVATVIIPDHIDRKHFEVTTPVPYLTVGPINAIGYHPSTIKSEHPEECEKIYQDHLAELYSEEPTDYSEESLEMARMPLFPEPMPPPSVEDRFEKMYSDINTK